MFFFFKAWGHWSILPSIRPPLWNIYIWTLLFVLPSWTTNHTLLSLKNSCSSFQSTTNSSSHAPHSMNSSLLRNIIIPFSYLSSETTRTFYQNKLTFTSLTLKTPIPDPLSSPFLLIQHQLKLLVFTLSFIIY